MWVDLEKYKAYVEKNKEKTKKIQHDYYIKNKKRLQKYKRKQYLKRRQSNVI